MDPDGDVIGVDVVDSPTVMEFVSFDSNSGTLEIEDLSSEDVSVGSFKIQIQLDDGEDQSLYAITLNVAEQLDLGDPDTPQSEDVVIDEDEEGNESEATESTSSESSESNSNNSSSSSSNKDGDETEEESQAVV